MGPDFAERISSVARKAGNSIADFFQKSFATQVSTADSLLESFVVTRFSSDRLFSQPDHHVEFCPLNL
jgi:hypothetical protein